MHRQYLESDKLFHLMTEVITEVFWMTEPKSAKILYVSPGYDKIWQRSRESLFSDPLEWMSFIVPEDRAIVQANWQRQISGESTQEEFRITRPDGSMRWIANRAYPVKDAEGSVHIVTGIAEDITARKQTEEERERLVRELQAAVSKVKQLSGLLPICSSCKRIRDDNGYWNQIELYIHEHSDAEFTHGICDECGMKLYPEQWKQKDKETT